MRYCVTAKLPNGHCYGAANLTLAEAQALASRLLLGGASELQINGWCAP